MGFGQNKVLLLVAFATSLNALTGIDGFWTKVAKANKANATSLNALTGIDGFWTR